MEIISSHKKYLKVYYTFKIIVYETENSNFANYIKDITKCYTSWCSARWENTKNIALVL